MSFAMIRVRLHRSHGGAMYVLQIARHVIAERSGEEAALALGMLDAELDQFMKAHAVAVQ
jgi:hypothetical protein